MLYLTTVSLASSGFMFILSISKVTEEFTTLSKLCFAERLNQL